MTREIVRLSICRLHGHQPSLVWKNLLTPKSEPDLTVDLSNCVGMKEWCDIHFCYYVSSHKILNQYIHTNQHWCNLKRDGAEYWWCQQPRTRVEEREQEDYTEDSRAPGFTPSSAEGEHFDNAETRPHHDPDKERRNTSGLLDEGS